MREAVTRLPVSWGRMGKGCVWLTGGLPKLFKGKQWIPKGKSLDINS